MHTQPPTLHQLAHHWPTLDLCQIQLLHRHARNVLSLLHAADGTRYLLRVAQHDRARLGDELDLVTRLQPVGLPFAIPAPIPTRTGDLFVALSPPGTSIALVYPFLAGAHSSGANQRHAVAAGRALARLQRALATVDDSPNAATAFPCAAQYAVAHPLVAQSRRWISDLPLAPEHHRRLHTVLDELSTETPAPYARLPQQ